MEVFDTQNWTQCAGSVKATVLCEVLFREGPEIRFVICVNVKSQKTKKKVITINDHN